MEALCIIRELNTFGRTCTDALLYILIVLFLRAPVPFNEKHLLHSSTKDKFSSSITKFWGSMEQPWNSYQAWGDTKSTFYNRNIMLSLCQSTHTAPDFYERIDEKYGIDEEGMGEQDDKGVSIPR